MTSITPIVKSPSRKVRKSPIDAACFAADKAVARAERRKSRSLKRVDRLKASIERVVAAASQHDIVIRQLIANAKALRSVQSASL